MENVRRLIGAATAATGVFFLGRAARSGVPLTSLAVGAALVGTGGVVLMLDELHRDTVGRLAALHQDVTEVHTLNSDALTVAAELGKHLGTEKERQDGRTLNAMEDNWGGDPTS